MNLKKYSIEEQTAIVKKWNWQYGKGLRTLEDLSTFDALFPAHLDDLLILMALDCFTDFHTHFKKLNPKWSICNIVYVFLASPDLDIERLFDLAKDYFSKFNFFGATKEEVVEKTLGFYTVRWQHEEEKRPNF